MSKLLDEFAPTAALGVLIVICLPMMVTALPFWALGRLAIALWERKRPTPTKEPSA